MEWFEIHDRLKADANDSDAFGALKALVQRRAWRELSDKGAHVVEDVVEDTCAAAVIDLGKARGGATFGGFVWGYYLNLRKRVLRDAVVPLGDHDPPAPEGNDPTGEHVEALMQCLDALSPRDRELIHHRFYSDLPHKAIAAAIGVGEPAVRVRFKRAMDRLGDCVRGKIAPKAVTHPSAG